MIKNNQRGLKEFLPLGLSPSKEKLLLVDGRGKSNVYIVDLPSKAIQYIDLNEYLDERTNNEDLSFNNIGFVSDSILSFFKSNKITLFDFKNQKLISERELPFGYFSSFNKKVEVIVTELDTIYIANYHSKRKSKFYNESDGIYDTAVLSLYSSSNNSFNNIYLPNVSLFKDKNIGQPIVNFVRDQERIYFSVSPENKIYTFKVDELNFQVSGLNAYDFTYTFSDTLLSFEKSNFIKDIYKLSMLNPIQEDIVLSNNYLLLSVVKSLNEDEYMGLLENYESEKKKLENFTKKRKAYVEILDVEKNTHLGHYELDESTFSISLKLTDSTFLLKPKHTFFYFNEEVPLYIAKLEVNEKS